MKYTDQHMHTISSPDAYPNATIENYIKQAKLLKQEALMLTDHVDIDSPVPMFFTYPNYKEYFAQVKEISDRYSFPIFTGVEVGFQPKSKEKIKNFVQSYPFDLVICSIHVADGFDFYYGDFFEGKSTNQSIMRYFEVVLEAVETFEDYDVFGHIDYITRYLDGVEDYDFERYKPILTKILQTIVQKNKAIEINTSKGSNKVFPSLEVLRLYKELGGHYLTIGSDAHTPSKLQQNFSYGLKQAKKAGFDQIFVYKKRRPYPTKIDALLEEK